MSSSNKKWVGWAVECFVWRVCPGTQGLRAEALKFVKEQIALGAKVKNVWAPLDRNRSG